MTTDVHRAAVVRQGRGGPDFAVRGVTPPLEAVHSVDGHNIIPVTDVNRTTVGRQGRWCSSTANSRSMKKKRGAFYWTRRTLSHRRETRPEEYLTVFFVVSVAFHRKIPFAVFIA